MEKDIVYYINLLKENIEKVEENENDNEALEKVKSNFLEVYEHIKIFLISKKEKYYGYFLMNLRLEIDFYKDIIAGVTVDTEPFTLIVNPLLLGKYKIKEMIYIICHEIEHIILSHPKEMVRLMNNKGDKNKLNYAMDASVNDRLDYEINTKSNILSTPNNAINSNKLATHYGISNVLNMQDFMYYYKLIYDKKDKSDNNENDIFVINIDNKEIITEKKSKGLITHNFTESDISEDIESRIKNFVKRTVDGIPDDKRGLFPSYQQEAINKVLAPPVIKWEQVLKKYIGLIPIPYKKTKMRLNRRQPERFDIRGRINDRTIRLVVAIDTSGSMSDSMLEKVFTEIFDILKRSKFELTIIECDAEIGKVYIANKISDVNMKVTGRGGTCFTPVIDYINKSGKYRDAVLVYFTDGFGENSIPKPKTYRNLWVIIGQKEDLSVKKTYGEVLEIGMNYYDDFSF